MCWLSIKMKKNILVAEQNISRRQNEKIQLINRKNVHEGLKWITFHATQNNEVNEQTKARRNKCLLTTPHITWGKQWTLIQTVRGISHTPKTIVVLAREEPKPEKTLPHSEEHVELDILEPTMILMFLVVREDKVYLCCLAASSSGLTDSWVSCSRLGKTAVNR